MFCIPNVGGHAIIRVAEQYLYATLQPYFSSQPSTTWLDIKLLFQRLINSNSFNKTVSRLFKNELYSVLEILAFFTFLMFEYLFFFCSRVNDETNSNRKCRERNINRQNSTSNLLPRQGKMMSNKL